MFKQLRFRDDEGRQDEIKMQALTRSQVQKLIEYCTSAPIRASGKYRDRIRMNRLGIHLDIYLGLRSGTNSRAIAQEFAHKHGNSHHQSAQQNITPPQ